MSSKFWLALSVFVLTVSACKCNQPPLQCAVGETCEKMCGPMK